MACSVLGHRITNSGDTGSNPVAFAILLCGEDPWSHLFMGRRASYSTCVAWV